LSQLELHKKIRGMQISPIYLLYGKETFLIEETEQLIISQTLTEDVMDFNFAVYDLEESPIELAIEDAETLPFLGEKRIVLVKNASLLTSAKQKIDHDIKKLERYIENPSETTVLIFHAPFEKLDERKKIVKLLKKNSDVLAANELHEEKLKSWIEGRANQLSVNITPPAIDKLLLLGGTQLMILVSELEKMALYVGDDGVIDEHVVNELVARTLEQNIFTLIDYIVKKKMDEAFQILYDLLKQKEEPIKILSLIARQFRIVYQVKELIKQGYGQKQIASLIKVHPYAVKLAANQGKSFSSEELLLVLNELADADFQMKTGKRDKKLVLDLFLTKLNTGMKSSI
jgi:DNA polymerase III subunit delta